MPGKEVRASNVRHAGVCGGMQHGYALILDCTHCVHETYASYFEWNAVQTVGAVTAQAVDPCVSVTL